MSNNLVSLLISALGTVIGHVLLFILMLQLFILNVIKYFDHSRWYENIPPGGTNSEQRHLPLIRSINSPLISSLTETYTEGPDSGTQVYMQLYKWSGSDVGSHLDMHACTSAGSHSNQCVGAKES